MNRYLCLAFASLALLGISKEAHAWSAQGHHTIGMLAISRLQDDTRDRLWDTVGLLDETVIGEACVWPDVIREEEAWEWSKPQHYINIPRGDSSYLQPRDCPAGRCATEAIKRYAAELGDAASSKEQHWQAFAWLCHLTADLHQPMHAGFADDRGGNDFRITFGDETTNLHSFWDRVLFGHDAGGWQDLFAQLQITPTPALAPGWKPADVDTWTNESHALARDGGYPVSQKLSGPWEQQAWKIAFERTNLAAARLALIIETVLAD